jgi:ABC-type dipeptide/oligopeptide/nickel transport system permease component
LKRGLKQVLIPLVTIATIQIAQTAGGTVIIATNCRLSRLGRFLVEASSQRDYSGVQGVNLPVASSMVCVNLLVDVTSAYLDPQIWY